MQVYVDTMKVGETQASQETPHHIVHRLCELDMHIASDMEQPPLQQGVGFRLKLPELPEGRHEVNTTISTGSGTREVENQRPFQHWGKG